MEGVGVLVVEDDELIRQLVDGVLEEAGYLTVAASSGAEAIGVMQRGDPLISALVSDVNLGRGVTDGWEVARRGRLLIPALAVVYMTGDAGAEWAASGVPNSILITKPFALNQIATAVAQLLNRGPLS